MNAKGTAIYHEFIKIFFFFGSSSVVLLETEADLITRDLFLVTLSIRT